MRRVARWFGLVAVVGIPTVLEDLGTAKPLDHGGDFGLGSQVPEGSASVCESLPDGVDFIPELRSGWAVAQDDSQSVRLVFSNAALECGDDPGARMSKLSHQCVAAWSYSLLVPSELLQPGTYDLAQYTVGYTDAQSLPDRGAGCGSDCSAGMTGGGLAPGGGAKVEATLEIYSASDECVTGRISGLKNNQIEPPPPEFNGGFHAVRCSPEDSA
jgi:hypothetical protein